MMFENNSPAKRLLPILHESEKENQILTINSDVTPTDPSAENFYVGYKQLTLTPDANAIIPSITTDAQTVQHCQPKKPVIGSFLPSMRLANHASKRAEPSKAGEQKREGPEKKALFSNKNASHEKTKSDETVERQSQKQFIR